MKNPPLPIPASGTPPLMERSRLFLRRLRGQSGQAVIEAALVLPVLLTALFGMIEFSILLFTYINANYACRSAVRSASMCSTTSVSPCTTTQIQSLVTTKLFLSSVITPTVHVTYLTPALGTGTNTIGNLVEVSVTWTQSVPIPFMTTNSVSVSAFAYRMISR